MIRNQPLLWVLSIGFELMEVRYYSLLIKYLLNLLKMRKKIIINLFLEVDFSAYATKLQ